MARPELPGAAAPIQPPVSPFRWAARTRFSNLLPKCSFIFRMVVVYWSWNCESCPEIKYFSLFLRTALLFQLIPARGRKPKSPVRSCEDVEFQLISARGRKHEPSCMGKHHNSISTYPRKGTETRCSRSVGCHPYNFNLSPQGDGNSSTGTGISNWSLYFNLSPQKPSQALRASSPEGRAFVAATYLVLSSPFRGSSHGVSRD